MRFIFVFASTPTSMIQPFVSFQFNLILKRIFSHLSRYLIIFPKYLVSVYRATVSVAIMILLSIVSPLQSYVNFVGHRLKLSNH